MISFEERTCGPINRILDLFGIEVLIIKAPMAGSAFSDMVVAVSQPGGLGSLACALLGVEQARKKLETIRLKTSRSINANFFCHKPSRDNRAREMSWRGRLDAYFVELGLDTNTPLPNTNRAPFGDKMCDLVMEFHPEVVSFHFGLPDKNRMFVFLGYFAAELPSIYHLGTRYFLNYPGLASLRAWT
jgi:nitronate monooxygenase